jgi:hypothetical protein
LQEQIDRRADYIRTHVMGNFKQAFGRIQKLQSDVDRAHTAVAEKSAEPYNKAMAELDKLRHEQKQTTALDLRWAIFGIYVVSVGVALSYCA